MTQSSFNFATQNATPMMQQYLSIKTEYRDAILFYRMGDFYEMFFEDAIVAAEVLGIALTKRGKNEGQDIPMCGVPFHAAESYLPKLIEAGKKIAICEQTETPEEAKKRGYKAVVRREVVRVITKGTILEENLLDASSSNYLAAITKNDNEIALSYADITTGEFAVLNCSIDSLSSNIARLNPKEILISETLYQAPVMAKIIADWKRQISTHVSSFFDVTKCERVLKNFFKINSLESLGNFSKSLIAASGAVVEYINITQKNNLPRLSFPSVLEEKSYMQIDPATRINLELLTSTSGRKDCSVFAAINKTVTSIGARLLAKAISSPLIEKEAINKRLDLIEFFTKNAMLVNKLREILAKITDFERALSRLSLSRGSPRDIVAIKNSILALYEISSVMEYSGLEITDQIKNLTRFFSGFDEIINEITHAFKDEAPANLREAGFIKEGYNARLDSLYDIKENANLKIQEMRQKYISLTGVSNLKINYNNLVGYYIEVSSQNVPKLNNEIFIHKQTLVNAARFTTSELKDLEANILSASDNIYQIELEIFESVSNLLLENSERLSLAAQSVANLDLASSLALLAVKYNFVRPHLDDSTDFIIEDGRHIVVEQTLKQDFTPNDCILGSNEKIWLLTGPNMAGKSTFLRQNALIAILAQAGCFVPAARAKIGIVDRVFSRVGASDDLARGRSTFMVEMVETATILNQATNKSLIILDEIGRGTSTFDGLSIAWGALEYLHDKIKARCLFATHYHELNNLIKHLPSLASYRVDVKEWNGEIVFLHKVVKGSADKSYGIYVARIAGIPNSVIKRASEILASLEKNDSLNEKLSNIQAAVAETPNEVEALLRSTDINNLSPKQALDLLYKMKEMV